MAKSVAANPISGLTSLLMSLQRMCVIRPWSLIICLASFTISSADYHGIPHHGINAAHFHMQDRSPGIELHATRDGVHIKTNPASLDVASKVPQSHRHVNSYGWNGNGVQFGSSRNGYGYGGDRWPENHRDNGWNNGRNYGDRDDKKGRDSYHNLNRQDDDGDKGGNGGREYDARDRNDKEAGERTDVNDQQHRSFDSHVMPPVRSHPIDPVNYSGNMLNSIVSSTDGYRFDINGYKKHRLHHRRFHRHRRHRRPHRKHAGFFHSDSERPYTLEIEYRGDLDGRNFRPPPPEIPALSSHFPETAGQDMPAARIPDQTMHGMARSEFRASVMDEPKMPTPIAPSHDIPATDMNAHVLHSPFTSEPFPVQDSQAFTDKVSEVPFLPRDFANQMPNMRSLMQGFYQSSVADLPEPFLGADSSQADYRNPSITGSSRMLHGAKKSAPLSDDLEPLSPSIGTRLYQTAPSFERSQNANDRIERILMGFPYAESKTAMRETWKAQGHHHNGNRDDYNEGSNFKEKGYKEFEENAKDGENNDNDDEDDNNDDEDDDDK